ncbi:MAG: YdeI/OmpD-associated family protein [Bacteroidota bacterium]
MVHFTATIKQFAQQGEKTGWTYIDVPEDIAQELKPGNKKSFRVKGKLDQHSIAGVALLPMGAGNFILPLNAAMRKGTHKKKGGMLNVQLAVDTKPLATPAGFVECLEDEPKAKAFFEKLKPSHRNYFIKWMGGVKSEAAVAKRIAQVVTALSYEQDFAAMFRSVKAAKEKDVYR